MYGNIVNSNTLALCWRRNHAPLGGPGLSQRRGTFSLASTSTCLNPASAWGCPLIPPVHARKHLTHESSHVHGGSMGRRISVVSLLPPVHPNNRPWCRGKPNRCEKGEGGAIHGFRDGLDLTGSVREVLIDGLQMGFWKGIIEGFVAGCLYRSVCLALYRSLAQIYKRRRAFRRFSERVSRRA